MASSPWTMSTMHSTMMVSRSIPRLRLVPRLFPRLGLRSTALSLRHVPIASSTRLFSTPANPTGRPFPPLDTYPARHIGPNPAEAKQMLAALGYDSMDAFVRDTVPDSIRIDAQAVSEHSIPALSESEMLRRAEEVANMNEKKRSFIGMGYWNAVVPQVILRNPEIAQGRLESLINFQTMVSSLTGLPIANASLLDEGTAAAEAMVMAFAQHGQKRKTVWDSACSWRCAKLIGEGESRQFGNDSVQLSDLAGVLVQYPDVNGSITDYSALVKHIKEASSGPAPLLACATDLLALAILTPPGELGFDIALGSSARFGVPVGYGGPHAAFFSVADALKRKIPGRLVGRSRDTNGRPAYRLALQTREQHIRREKATSNICTSQALLANTAAMYAVWHGAEGVRAIAERVLGMTAVLDGIIKVIDGMDVQNTSGHFFDTLTIDTGSAQKAAKVHAEAAKRAYNLRIVDERTVGVTFDESVTEEELAGIANCFLIAGGQAPIASTDLVSFVKGGITPLIDADAVSPAHAPRAHSSTSELLQSVPSKLRRSSPILTQPVFNTHHSETELLRYIHALQEKDLSLVHAMIPLGSCTMKLNASAAMRALTWPEFGGVHPFVPNGVEGWKVVVDELSRDLCTITGFAACSLQPNSGAAGEYAGLSVIRAYHASRGEQHRDICLIPASAHGTNPASAVMAGMKVVPVKNLPNGNLDLDDLREKAAKHKDRLGAFMITYPSLGVFEPGFKRLARSFMIMADKCISMVGSSHHISHEIEPHQSGKGANLNAQIGMTNPAICGGDVCHLNLHKTFAIPHGGGGPGVGPICVAEHLAPFLPSHPIIPTGGSTAIEAVASAPYGSASVLLISWAYVKMLGGQGLSDASKLALLNANYIAHRLGGHYSLKYKERQGPCGA
ncbi:The glycine cleavage system catalyzes the degradation of glycine [Rhizoctonia solani]|uniref:Glycine cleavage system P protein n=1 Tax=Rhizoctonia solani TaxID=456999 RepID=A0A8H7ICU0_9AGAM|nr:The glycine cleavage system catalyzes the degradation of glycine [Rhizoctonia solani]